MTNCCAGIKWAWKIAYGFGEIHKSNPIRSAWFVEIWGFKMMLKKKTFGFKKMLYNNKAERIFFVTHHKHLDSFFLLENCMEVGPIYIGYRDRRAELIIQN